MTDSINIYTPQIKSLDKNALDNNSSYQDVIELDELYFEDYMRQKFCYQCGKDHRFKPSFKGLQTNIDHAPELVTLFFNEGSTKVE